MRENGGPPSLRGRVITAAALSAALLHPIAWCLARWLPLADLITHFQMPAFVATLAAVAVMAARNRWTAACLIVLASWQLAPLVRHLGPNPVEPAKGPRLRILMANVFHGNTEYQALAGLIWRERPDVVGIVELSPEWIEGLERTGIRREFPFRTELPWEGMGLGLWCRERPISVTGPLTLLPTGNPVVRADIPFGGSRLRIWLVHPPNPLGANGGRNADRDLAALGEWIGRGDGPRLVIGDMNRTDGSPHFAAFLAATGLRDSRAGFGTQASWPSWSPYRIAIDHALVSDDVAVVSRRLGPDIGSDHRPLLLEIAPASSAAISSSAAGAH